MRLADEGGHQCHHQQQDQPGGVYQQAGGEADHRDRVLRLPEQLAHQVHPPHGLAARAIQLVLQIRILEVLQIQPRRVFHQADAGGVGEQFRQQRVGVADEPAQQIRQDGQAELQRQQAEQRVELSVAPDLGQPGLRQPEADQADGFVDDQLAHVQRGDRQQRADQAQAKAGQGQAGAGRPDLFQERRQVAHRVEAIAQAGAGLFTAPGFGAGGGRGTGAEAMPHCACLARPAGNDVTVRPRRMKRLAGVQVAGSGERNPTPIRFQALMMAYKGQLGDLGLVEMRQQSGVDLVRRVRFVNARQRLGPGQRGAFAGVIERAFMPGGEGIELARVTPDSRRALPCMSRQKTQPFSCEARCLTRSSSVASSEPWCTLN